MADIFLSYSNQDRAAARALATALQAAGWDVFWDREVPAGISWRSHIEAKLAGARCVIVIWSQTSTKSEWVLEEAESGKERGILVPVLLEAGLSPPFGFRTLQAVEIEDWTDNLAASGFRTLSRSVSRLVGNIAEEDSLSDLLLDTLTDADVEDLKTTDGTEAWAEESKAKGPLQQPVLMAAEPRSRAGLDVNGQSGTPRPGRREDGLLNPRLLVAGGDFLMGSDAKLPGQGRSESPAHLVRVSAFYMQKHQVTNEEFQRFLPSWQFSSATENHPAVAVTWEQAQGYAEWLGGSLPSEAQWEYAARGAEGREYPWGADEPTCALANFKGCGTRVKPVGQHRSGATPEGIEDLAGNVYEWCLDFLEPYAQPKPRTALLDQVRGTAVLLDPLGRDSGLGKAVRGGDYGSFPKFLRGAHRRGSTFTRLSHIGFRVVWTEDSG